MNKVVAFEGLDYAGKSTMIETILKKMEDDGLERPVLLAEPRKDSDEWKALRKMIISPTMPKVAQIHMSVAQRVALYQERVCPSLKTGCNVITDRCLLTSMVYQQDDKHGADEILLANVQGGRFLEHNVVPDVIVYLNIDHPTYIERLGQGRDETEAVETYISDPKNFQRFKTEYENALRKLRLTSGVKVIYSNDPDEVYKKLKELAW
ncbi:thymidylate kinase [Vibrio phage phiKT1019]|nr:thymidylate kinase [Vibrio phage phiKT1019]